MSRGQNEFKLACAIADYLDRCAPSLPFTHVPLGEHRNAVTGARLKRMGTKRGWPDYVCPVPPHGRLLAMELKAEGGRQSPDQKAVQAQLEAAGARYVVIRSLDDLRQTLAEEGVPTREAPGGTADATAISKIPAFGR